MLLAKAAGAVSRQRWHLSQSHRYGEGNPWQTSDLVISLIGCTAVPMQVTGLQAKVC